MLVSDSRFFENCLAEYCLYTHKERIEKVKRGARAFLFRRARVPRRKQTGWAKTKYVFRFAMRGKRRARALPRWNATKPKGKRKEERIKGNGKKIGERVASRMPLLSFYPKELKSISAHTGMFSRYCRTRGRGTVMHSC